ncbi:MAG: ABC transporter permease [Acidimicrobiia bacterium]
MTAAVGVPVAVPPAGGSLVRTRRFLRNPAAVAGALFLLVVVLLAAFPGVIAPYSASAQSLVDRYASPSRDHLLGCDAFGRDVLSRVIYGARTSCLAAVQGTAIAVLLGVPAGMTAAYVKGRVQFLFDRGNEMLMSVPALLLAIVIIGALGPSLFNAMVGVGVALSPRFYRIASAATMDVQSETFVEASRSLGCSRRRVLARHILPNILSSIVVQASLTVGSVILAESSLSFLGLGVQPPTPSWGGMLRDAAGALYEAPFLVYGPGAMIVLTVLASQFAADGLRDALGGLSSTTRGGR